jgi:hypothetical protein
LLGLKVLLTNTHLVHRGGTELYIRDLATALLRMGHKPVVYSPRLGGVAEEIRALTIPVVNTLEALVEPPDLIHGQHHLETMTALWRFPDTPALYVSHGFLPWQEAPPLFPRILQYVVVGVFGRERLTREFGIDPDRVTIVHNFVDLKRFRPRIELPARPRSALLFGNWPSEAYRDAVLQACADRSITLDLAGHGLGTATNRPETLLHQYDLVFAVGRSALEAMATGAAVILASPAGLGPLVTTTNFDRLRSINFAIRALTQPCDPPLIGAEIDRYDPVEALLVSEKVGQTAGLDAAGDTFVALYEDVLTRWRATTRDRAAEERATSEYLQWFSRTVIPRIGDELRQWEERMRTPLPADVPEVAFNIASTSASPAELHAASPNIDERLPPDSIDSRARGTTASNSASQETAAAWQPLVQAASAALDDGRLAEGRAACLALLGDVGLPEDVRDLVYAIQAELAQPLADFAPSATRHELVWPAPDGAARRDPSPVLIDERLLVFGRSRRATADAGQTGRNDVLLRLDGDDTIADIVSLVDETGLAHRFDDVRPFLLDGLLHAAVLLDDPDVDGGVQAGIVAIDHGAFRNPRWLGPRAGAFLQGWAPISASVESRFLAWWEPTEVLRLDRETGVFQRESLRRASHVAERFWSGSQGVSVPGGSLLLVNETAGLDGIEETVTTRFVLLDTGFRLAGISPPFFVADRGNDVATGLARRGDRLVAGFTSGEASAVLVSVALVEALAMIMPIGTPGDHPLPR